MKTISKLLAIATLATGLNVASVQNANAGLLVSPFNPGLAMFLTYSGYTVGLLGWGLNNYSMLRNGFVLMVLDEKTNDIEFTPVDPKTAAEIGLTKEEAESYNDEVDRLNATFDEVDSDLQNAPKNELEEIENKSLAKIQDQVSPATLSAVKKIVSYNTK